MFTAIYTLKKPTLKEFIRVAVINKRLKANKPVSVSIEGESGAGKSILTLIIANYIKQLLNAKCSINKHLIYTPADFERVANHVFFEENCDLPAVFVQETVSFAPNWWHPLSKKNPANKIYSILVLSREVRPIAFFVCEQQFFDLYSKLRTRMNMLFRVIRYVDSEGRSLQPIVKIYERIYSLKDIAFVEPILRVNGSTVSNYFFEIPKLDEKTLAKFKQFDREFKRVYISKLTEKLSATANYETETDFNPEQLAEPDMPSEAEIKAKANPEDRMASVKFVCEKVDKFLVTAPQKQAKKRRKRR